MEACLLSTNGCRNLKLRPQPYPPNSPVQRVFYLANLKRKSSVSCTATATGNETTSEAVVPSSAQRHRSTRRSTGQARQAALREVQKSSDLKSALGRFAMILRAQELNVLLRDFGKKKQRTALTQLFEWMRKHGKINSSSYSSYIKFMGDGLDPSKAVEIYDGISDGTIRSNASVCNSVLGTLVKNSLLDQAMIMFYQMKQNGLCPDIITYSTLLAGCIKVKDGYSKAMRLVKELEDNEVEMDSVSYGTLIAICASNSLWKEAEEYFMKMRAEGHSPNSYHYSSLLNAYSADGNYQKADELVKDMKSLGLVPNKVILTTLLKVYVRAGLFDQSRKLLLELEALGYAGNEMPYCLLMDSLSKTGKIDEAKVVFDEMNQRQVKSDGYAYSIMISALCRGGKLEEAKLLARDYEAKNGKFDVVILNTMLCAYCRVHDMESVMQVMRKMDVLAVSPDRNTFLILIKYFCKEKLYLLAYRTLEDMHNKGHQPSEEICTALISHLGKMGSHTEAYSVYVILRYTKRALCKAIHEKILQILLAGRLLKEAYVVVKDNWESISKPAMRKFLMAFMKFGNINMINDVLRVVDTSGYNIDQEAFQLAISCYISKPDKKELLLQLLKWMTIQGYAVDSETRNRILKNSHLYGNRVINEILSKHHPAARAKGHVMARAKEHAVARVKNAYIH